MKTTFPLPTHCPSCDGPVRLDDKEINLWCDNPACPAKLEERVLHWLKRLEILGIGPAAVKALCTAGIVTDISDLYYLTPDKVARCISGSTMPGRIVELILEKNEIPLWQFLAALGIHGLGRTTSKLVAKEYKTLAAIREVADRYENGILEGVDDSLVSATISPDFGFTVVENVGEIVSKSIVDGLLSMKDTINRVTECIDVLEVEDLSGPLTGKSFCLTGALPSGTKRQDMAVRIEAAGGEVKSSVGKGLSYLVQADPNKTSGKSDKAKKLGTEIISEDQLLEMMA